MGALRNISQKIKGEAQQVIGTVQQHNGHGIKGGMTKAKGKVNEFAGDVKLKTRNEKNA